MINTYYLSVGNSINLLLTTKNQNKNIVRLSVAAVLYRVDSASRHNINLLFWCGVGWRER